MIPTHATPLTSAAIALAALIAVLSTVTDSIAQQFTADLEIRPRLEVRNGFKTPILEGQNPAAFVEQRSRLALNFTDSPIAVRLVMQDVRIWGNHGQIYKTEANLSNVYEAWAQYAFNEAWLVRFGRMQLNYDNARFLGNLDWAQQGRSHDALLFRHTLTPLRITVDAALTWNQAGFAEPGRLTDNFYPLGAANNKTMQFIWVNKQYDEASISVLLHNDGRQLADESMAWMQTMGTFMQYRLGEYNLQGEGYYQTGDDAAGNETAAWLVGLESTRKLDDLTLGLGLDVSSGSESGSTSNNSFMPLYGTNHKFYGFMDYFHVGNAFRQPGGGFDVGLVDVFQKLSWSARADLTLALRRASVHGPSRRSGCRHGPDAGFVFWAPSWIL